MARGLYKVTDTRAFGSFIDDLTGLRTRERGRRGPDRPGSEPPAEDDANEIPLKRIPTEVDAHDAEPDASEPAQPEPPQPIDRRNLKGLQPAFRAKVERILARLQSQGWRPFVVEGLRTRAQQARKVRLGYSKTMSSRHLTGNAADIVDERWGWDGPAKDPDHAFWRDLGRAAAAEGLTWGGSWKRFKDVAHVQQ